MNNKITIEKIRQLIANDELKIAFQHIQTLLGNKPKLDDAILQSARYNDIQNQIHSGIVSHEDAKVTKNQIRVGLLHLLRQIEDLDENTPSTAEADAAASKDSINKQKADKIYNINKIDQANFS